MRIIGGQYKRTPIQVVDAPGLRPSPDRVRETLFNWLGQSLSGWACLDLFAGTGALGFEAASRGANSVLLVESAAPVMAAIKTLQAKLQSPAVQLLAQDALVVLQRLAHSQPNSIDLVFLDPPFNQGWYNQVLPRLPAVLKPQGLLYLESAQAWSELASEPTSKGFDQWEVVKQDKAGQVHFHLLRLKALEPV